MEPRKLVAYLLSAALVLTQAVWPAERAQAAVTQAAHEVAAPREAPPAPTQPVGKPEEQSLGLLSLSPANGQVLHLLGGGGVRLHAAFRSPDPATEIQFSYSVDGVSWIPIAGEQDTGTKSLTGRLAMQRSMLWDISHLPDGAYQLKAAAAGAGKTAEQIHEIVIDRAAVLPTAPAVAGPMRLLQTAPGPKGQDHHPEMITAPGPQGQSLGEVGAVSAMAALSEPISLAYLFPTNRVFMGAAWAEADYISVAELTDIEITYRSMGSSDPWAPVATTYDSGLVSWPQGDGTSYSYRYIEFNAGALGAGVYELQFVATDTLGQSRTDLTTFEVGEFEPTYIGPNSGRWYGQGYDQELWIEVDFYAAREPVSITFHHRRAGESQWQGFEALSYDSGLRKWDYGTVWFAYRYVEWDATSWPDGAYEVQYAITDVQGNSLSGLVVYNLDRTPPEAPELNVVAGHDGESFHLSWQGAADVAEYRVERYDTYNGYWYNVAWLDNTSYEDTQVARGNQYSYRVRAIDWAGNESTASNEVTVLLPYIGPELDYSWPDGSLQYVNGDLIYFEVQFRDDVAITQIDYEYTADGQTWLPMPATNDTGILIDGERYYRHFYLDTFSWPDGYYQWRVTATDASGRSRTLTGAFMLDREVTISNLQVERLPNHELRVSWDPISDGSYFYLYVYRDGYWYTYYSLDGRASSYTSTYPMDSTYRFVLYAYDLAGNYTEAEVTYELYNGPPLTIHNSNPSYTNQSPYTVSGQTDPGAIVTVAGSEVELQVDGSFAADVPLTLGQNAVIITATQDGATRTTMLAVHYDTTPPTSFYLSPSNGTRVGPSFELYGEVYEPDGITHLSFQMKRPDGDTWLPVYETTSPQRWGGWSYTYASVDATQPLADGAPLSSGTHLWRLQATDIYGNVGTSEERSLLIDLTGPAAPTGVTATAGVRAVDLTWGASPDADAQQYRIYRATSSGGPYEWVATKQWWDTRTYRDSNVEVGTTYSYVITARDDVGNEGEPSAEVSATPLVDNAPPVVTSWWPGNGAFVAGPQPTIWVYFNDDDAHLVESAVIEWSNDGGASWHAIPNVQGPYLNYGNEEYAYVNWNTAGLPSGTYQIRATLTDRSGNVGTGTVTYTTDFFAATPQNLTATTGHGGTVVLTWDSVTDGDHYAYEILRSSTSGSGYVHVDTVYYTTNSYTDTNVQTNQSYYYVVRSQDYYGNRSGLSSEVGIEADVDTVAPQVTNLYVYPRQGQTFGGSSPSFTIYAADNRQQPISYNLAYSQDGGESWTEIPFWGPYGSGLSSYINGNFNVAAMVEGEITLRVILTDAAGNVSTHFEEMVLDLSTEAVQELSAYPGQNSAQLLWAPVEDPHFSFYQVRRATQPGGPYTTVVTLYNRTTDSYLNAFLNSGTTYYYVVDTYDQFGNTARSAEVSVTPQPDTIAPVITSVTPADGTALGNSPTVNVYFSENADPRLVTGTMEYSADGDTWTMVGAMNNAGSFYQYLYRQWNITGMADGEFLVRYTITDGAGLTDQLVVTYHIDLTPPGAVTLTAAGESETRIRLNWTASDPDVQSYRIERSANEEGPFTQIATVGGTTLTYLNTVTPGQTHYYRVTPRDRFRDGPASNVAAAVAVQDSVPPVVTHLSPADGLRPTMTRFQAQATDNLSVARIALEYSLDGGTTWTEFAAVNAASMSYDWNTTGLFPSGSTVKVRATARDGAGNESDGTPVRTYTIDNEAPSAPANLVAVSTVTKITVAWDLPPAGEGVTRFNLYRSTDGSSLALYRSGFQATGFEDNWVEQGVTYHYVATALDAAGNESSQSEPVAIALLPDNQPPVILSVNPGGGTVGANPNIWVSAQDNYRLQSISLSYRQGGGAWIEIGTALRSGRTDGASFAWNTAGLTDGSYQLKAVAVDQAGNTSQEVLFGLNLDLTPPPAPVLTATPGGWSMQLNWTASGAPDLWGYRLLRQRADGTWQTLGQTGALTATDQPLNPSGTYTYAVEAVDIYGNAARSAPVTAQPLATDPFPPTAYAGGNSTVYAGTLVTFNGTGSRDNDRIDSYLWTFPDGSTESGASVQRLMDQPGTYTVLLTVTDPAGNQGQATVTVTVRPQPVVGNLTVVVKDKNTGSRIGGASVVMQIPGGDLLHFTSNGNGEVNLVAPPGDYTAHAYKTGYLPDNVAISVTQGGGGTYDLLLETGEIVRGELTVERMTLDQIVEAGVDITKPENQWVYKFEIHLAFQNDPAPPQPQTIIVNYQGGTLGGSLAPIPIGGGMTGPGGTYVPAYVAYPTVIPSPRPEVEPTIAYLVIPGKASFLKEFFEVQLRLLNNAAEQYVIDNAQATLNLPQGVVLAPTAQPQSLTVDLGQLAGQEEKVVKWVIRGDEEGDYHLTADFTGTLMPFGDTVSGHFATAQPFHVWGPSAVKLIVEPQERATAGAPYHLRLSMQNVTDQPLPSGALDPAHVYNAAIELLEGGKQNYIYAPNQQLLRMNSDLASGEIFSADFYLIPCISGILALEHSYVLRTGGNAEFATELRPGHAAPYPGLAVTVSRVGNQVTVSWEAAPGAVEYRVYAVRQDLLMSTQADMVGATSATGLTLTEADGPRAYVIMVVDGEGNETLQHVVSELGWCSDAALPVVTVDPEEVTVGQEATILITANSGGYPVSGGVVSVGSYASNVPLNANGQASVTFTPAQAGPIEVSIYRNGELLAQTTIVAVADADTIPPTTDINTATASPGLYGWYYGPATITLTAQDNEGGSGVASIHYSLDGTNYAAYTDPFTVAQEGETTIHYFAVDVAGNQESPKTAMVRIDLGAPVTTGSLSGGVLTLTATDTGSGVASTEYRVDDGPWQSYTAPVTLPAGFTSVNFRSTDHAGRTEAPKTLTNSPLEWNTPTDMVAGEVLPVHFSWLVGGEPTLDYTVSVRVRNATTGAMLITYVYGGDIAYDPATGQYELDFDSALFGLPAGTRLEVQVYVQRRLQGSMNVEIQ